MELLFELLTWLLLVGGGMAGLYYAVAAGRSAESAAMEGDFGALKPVPAAKLLRELQASGVEAVDVDGHAVALAQLRLQELPLRERGQTEWAIRSACQAGR